MLAQGGSAVDAVSSMFTDYGTLLWLRSAMYYIHPVLDRSRFPVCWNYRRLPFLSWWRRISGCEYIRLEYQIASSLPDLPTLAVGFILWSEGRGRFYEYDMVRPLSHGFFERIIDHDNHQDRLP